MPNLMPQAEHTSMTPDLASTPEYPVPAASSSSGVATSSTDPAPSTSSDCSSLVAGCVDSTPVNIAVSVGPFLFEEARLRSMEAALKPGAEVMNAADEARDRSKSARKALVNSGRRPTSCYKGVNLHCRSNRWETHIWDGHQVHVGCFDTELQAAIAYDIVALKLRGAKAKLNFIPSSYDAEMAVLEKMGREEVLMAMRGVTFKDEMPKDKGDKQARDVSPPRTRKQTRQPSRHYLEAEEPPVKRRRRAPPSKQRAALVNSTKGRLDSSAALQHPSKTPVQTHAQSLSQAPGLSKLVLKEIDCLSEPDRTAWPPVAVRPINTHRAVTPSAAAAAGGSATGGPRHSWHFAQPDSPTLHPVHPSTVHPSDLIVNIQSTICTTQDTCSLLPSNWHTQPRNANGTTNSVACAGGCPAFLPFDDEEDVDPLSQSMSAVSSDTNLSTVSEMFGFEDFDQFDQSMLAAGVEPTAWNLTEFNPDTFLLEPDYVEPWLQG